MKIQNADSRDNKWYEIHVICRTEKEFDKTFQNLKSADFDLNIEGWGEEIDVISVSCERTDYDNKTEFVKDVRKIAKK